MTPTQLRLPTEDVQLSLTSPMRYFSEFHGIFASPASFALVRYVFSMSIQTWKSDSLKSYPTFHPTFNAKREKKFCLREYHATKSIPNESQKLLLLIYLAVLSAFLHHGMKERQHEHQRREGVVRTVHKTCSGDLEVRTSQVQLQTIRWLRHNLQQPIILLSSFTFSLTPHTGWNQSKRTWFEPKPFIPCLEPCEVGPFFQPLNLCKIHSNHPWIW